jgi:hypothetical protein
MLITGKEILENTGLLEAIETGLERSEMQNYDGRIHASSSGYCSRRGALEATYKGMRKYEAKSALYFKLGLALEDSVLDALDSQKRLFFRQYHLPEIGINLGGKVDGIVLHNGKLHCLEIKSCGSTLPTKPDDEHLTQINIYSAVTGLPGLLLYVSRTVQDYNGNLKLKLFDLGFNADMGKSLRSSALAYFASKNELLPDIPDHITSEKDCGYCNFKNLCWQFEVSPVLQPMTPTENEQINAAADKFISNFMQVSELKKRRNGVLKFLSENGNKTAKFYLAGESWDSILMDY